MGYKKNNLLMVDLLVGRLISLSGQPPGPSEEDRTHEQQPEWYRCRRTPAVCPRRC
ncbi:hypothetical protein EMIT0P74_10295 [Pseudomonas sp. IT-P74]